jgi:hypothetical protein
MKISFLILSNLYLFVRDDGRKRGEGANSGVVLVLRLQLFHFLPFLIHYSPYMAPFGVVATVAKFFV